MRSLSRAVKAGGVAFVLIGVAIALLLLDVVRDEGEPMKGQPALSPPYSDPLYADANVNQPVFLNGIRYTVRHVKEVERLTDDVARGVFLVVKIEFKNVRDEVASTTSTKPLLVGGSGNTYSFVPHLSENAVGLRLQPDVTGFGTLVFDLPPAEAKVARLLLEHCSATPPSSGKRRRSCERKIIAILVHG